MSLKDIVATHEEYFGAASLTDNEKKEEKPPKQPVKKKPERVKRTKDEDFDMKKKVYKPVQAHLKKRRMTIRRKILSEWLMRIEKKLKR